MTKIQSVYWAKRISGVRHDSAVLRTPCGLFKVVQCQMTKIQSVYLAKRISGARHDSAVLCTPCGSLKVVQC